MTFLKPILLKGAVLGAIAGGALAATATSASAYVACNGAGECWRVRERYAYPPDAGVVFHNDYWAYHHHNYHWRWRHDRFDRGYYRNGVWITF
ncbi:MAG TPA: hypothetical protein VMT68_03640 [Caulobacteraceae bacterium]|nr:hypothetical protein [Caulobacteraceae bacterium]